MLNQRKGRAGRAGAGSWCHCVGLVKSAIVGRGVPQLGSAPSLVPPARRQRTGIPAYRTARVAGGPSPSVP